MSEADTRAAPRPEGPVLTDWAARSLDAVRWVAIVVLVADVLLGLLTIPRDSTLGELRRDLADDRVQSLSVVAPTDLRTTHVLAGWLPSNDDDIRVLWRVGELGYRVAVLPGASADARRDVVDEAMSATPDAVGHDLLLRWSGAGTAVLVVLVLVLMLGPQPRRATKWALFWLVLMPLNAGMIWALLREAPWSSAARAWPAPAPHRFQPGDRRHTGGASFVWLLLACLLGQIVLHGLAQHTW